VNQPARLQNFKFLILNIMKPLKKKLTKDEMRVKKHAKEIRELLKNSKIKVSAKQIANL
jgi:hypothetical protein